MKTESQLLLDRDVAVAQDDWRTVDEVDTQLQILRAADRGVEAAMWFRSSGNLTAADAYAALEEFIRGELIADNLGNIVAPDLLAYAQDCWPR